MRVEHIQLLFVIKHDVLEGSAFPQSPFKKAGWRGLAFNRDAHGNGGLPRKVFDSVLSTARNRGSKEFLLIPAAFSIPHGPESDICVITDWNDYILALNRTEFLPEYYVSDREFSFVIWVDPDASVLGASKGLIDQALACIGDFEDVQTECAAEFGVLLDDPASKMASYLRNLGAVTL